MTPQKIYVNPHNIQKPPLNMVNNRNVNNSAIQKQVSNEKDILSMEGRVKNMDIQEEVEKEIISKQLEEIEKQHTGLADMQTMSEMTSISKRAKVIKAKDYQNQRDTIDEQTHDSHTQAPLGMHQSTRNHPHVVS